MSAEQQGESVSNEGATVIPFPTSRRTPPPLPRLQRAIPMPGARMGSSPLFEAALTRRFDREAA